VPPWNPSGREEFSTGCHGSFATGWSFSIVTLW
jgi:hypothetical protein